MYRQYTTANKKTHINWNDYESSESEPNIRDEYYMSPELEDELLNSGYFLKARVQRNMRKIRREYGTPLSDHRPVKHYQRHHHLRLA